MSASFFLRELKRLGTLTLAAWILPLCIYGLTSVLRLTELSVQIPDGETVRGLVLALAVLVAPWILGAASFAPERESGAASFLARLPLPTWKLLLMRFAAISTCLACIHVPVWTLASHWDFPVRVQEMLLGASAISVTLLAGATYASLAFKRSLSAFAVGPVLVWTAVYGLALPWVMLGARFREEEVFGGLGLLALAAVVCIVWAAKAQKPLSGLHPIRAAWRPVVLLCLLNAGSAGAFTLVDRSYFNLGAGDLHRIGDTAGITVVGHRGSRMIRERSQVLLSRGGKVAVLPEGHFLVGLTGSVVFTHTTHQHRFASRRDASLWRLDDLTWCDPRALQATPEEIGRHDLERLYRGYSSDGPLGYYGSDLLWAGEVPCEAHPSWLLTAMGVQYPLPEGWTVRAAGGSSVIARTVEGELRLFRLREERLDLLAKREAWIDLGELCSGFTSLEDVVPSSSGECLLAYGKDSQGSRLAGLDLRDAEPETVEFFRPAQRVISALADPATPTAVGVRWSSPGQNDDVGKNWDPTPLSVGDPKVKLPVASGEGYLFVGDQVQFGVSGRSREVSLPN
jgi:hypothetical protein